MATTPFATYFGNRSSVATPLGSSDTLLVLQSGTVKAMAGSQMGAGSGLDADLLDGIQGNGYQRAASGDATKTWVNVVNSSNIFSGAGNLSINLRNGGYHKFYRVSVYGSLGGGNRILNCYVTGQSYFDIQYGTDSTYKDILWIHTEVAQTIYYTVDVWE